MNHGKFDEKHIANIRSMESAWTLAYDDSYKDLLFYNGNQWADEDKRKRIEQRRPALISGVLTQYAHSLEGRFLQSQRVFEVSDIGLAPSHFGEDDLKPHDIMQGLLLDIQRRSHANDHYARSVRHAVESGFGWLRAHPIQSPNEFGQTIEISSMENRFSVYVDHLAQKPDMSDMRYAVVSSSMSVAEFKDKYGMDYDGIDLFNSERDRGNRSGEYINQDRSVRVYEYYWLDEVDDTLIQLPNHTVLFAGDLPERIRDDVLLQAVQKETRKRTRCKWIKTDGVNNLTKEHTIPCSFIPIAMIRGHAIEHQDESSYIGYYGITHFVKDLVSLDNYTLTMAAENMLNQPKSKILVSDEQLRGYQDVWDRSASDSSIYLPYNETHQPPVAVNLSSNPAPEAHFMSFLSERISQGIGVNKDSLGQVSNARSGTAINQRDGLSQLSSLHIFHSADMAINKIARAIVEMIPIIYDTNRMITIYDRERNKNTQALINNVIIDEATNQPVVVNDLVSRRFDVNVKSGVGYDTEREMLNEMIMQLFAHKPEIGMLLMDEYVRNSNMPNADKLANRILRSLPRHILSQKDAELLPPPEPDPNEELEVESKKADIEKTMADIELVNAKIEQEKQSGAMEAERLAREKLDKIRGS